MITAQDFCPLASQERLEVTNQCELFVNRLVLAQGGRDGDRGRVASQDFGPLEPQERLQVTDEREFPLDRLVVTQGSRDGERGRAKPSHIREFADGFIHGSATPVGMHGLSL